MIKNILFFTSLFASLKTAAVCVDFIPDLHPNERYQINSDGTVFDFETGITWDRCTYGLSGEDCNSGNAILVNWEDALSQTQKLTNYKGSSNWRLPNVKEMHSLTTERCYQPAVNESIFPNTPLGAFWTSTPYPSLNSAQDNWSYFVDSHRGVTLPDSRTLELHIRLIKD